MELYQTHPSKIQGKTIMSDKVKQPKWKYNKPRTFRYMKSEYGGVIVEHKPFSEDFKYTLELPKLLK